MITQPTAYLLGFHVFCPACLTEERPRAKPLYGLSNVTCANCGRRIPVDEPDGQGSAPEPSHGSC